MNALAQGVGRSFAAYLAVGLAGMRAYAAECLLGLLTYPLELALAYLMWRCFLVGGAGGMSGREAAAYYAIVLLIGRVGPSRFLSLRFESEVVTGNLAVYLVRPVVPWAAIAGRELAPAIVNLALLTPLAAAVAVAVLEGGVHPLAFTAWMLLAVALQTLIRLLVGVTAFWWMKVVGLVHAVEMVKGLASGAVLPLAIFPETVRALLDWTPFPLLVWVPARAMLGQLGPEDAARHAGAGVVWLVLLGALFLHLWGRGVRRFTGHGG